MNITYIFFHILIFLSNEGNGLDSSKSNAITFYYTYEIHKFLVKISVVTW